MKSWFRVVRRPIHTLYPYVADTVSVTPMVKLDFLYEFYRKHARKLPLHETGSRCLQVKWRDVTDR